MIIPGFVLLCTLVLVVPAGHGQNTADTGARQGLLGFLPSAAAAHAEALGNRVLRAGKERTVLTGRLVDDRGEAIPMRVMLQLPRTAGLEGVRPNTAGIVFDGRNPVHSISRVEEQLLETFSSDTAEAMLAFVKEEAAVQLLGRGVKETPGNSQDASPRFYDVFEVATDASSSPAGIARLKRYSFDSFTGLLASTQYLDEALSPPLQVEIRFSDWQGIEGSAYPGRIDRLENGRLAFSWITTRIQALPRQDSNHFEFPRETGQKEEQ
jgi:hypothetical protein